MGERFKRAIIMSDLYHDLIQVAGILDVPGGCGNDADFSAVLTFEWHTAFGRVQVRPDLHHIPGSKSLMNGYLM